jgi:hypothetical protein
MKRGGSVIMNNERNIGSAKSSQKSNLAPVPSETQLRAWERWASTRDLTKEDLDFGRLRYVENSLEKDICLFYEYRRESSWELFAEERARGGDPEMHKILAEGHAQAWGHHTLPECLHGLCPAWPNTAWLALPGTQRKRIVNMLRNPLRDLPKFEPDEFGFSGIPIFRTQKSFSDEDWKALAWFRANPEWPSPFKLVRFSKNPSRDRIFAALSFDLNTKPGALGKRLEKWFAACLREAKIQQRTWRTGRKSGHLQQFGIEGSPLDLLRALAAFRMHRREKNFDKACTSSMHIAGKAIYKDERKWQAAIRKARDTLQTLFPTPE